MKKKQAEIMPPPRALPVREDFQLQLLTLQPPLSTGKPPLKKRAKIVTTFAAAAAKKAPPKPKQPVVDVFSTVDVPLLSDDSSTDDDANTAWLPRSEGAGRAGTVL
jgi:hypothetical protein